MTVSREKASLAVVPPSDSEQIEWSAEEEIQLFFALEGLKPVGINKHFYMACIADRLSKNLQRDVPAEAIWAHLRTMYNLDVLDELEPLPFPNEEREFSLPETEFSALLSKKRAESEEKQRLSSVDSSGGPPSIIAVATDNTTKSASSDKTSAHKANASSHNAKEMDKKITAKLTDMPKRAPKRTRGSLSLESNSSPSTTPPPVQSNKRRRI
ncbi:PREDICTED: MRG/MORF4L-binding protein [Bactrocera latifrons]|uniref:MRG-binding protein n=1 Tax=Bactrocera latifrons TaxID=174628 RepID=A0A0K8VMZ7_BACLA|nr:PREDICTED: MRG/MORF4L-binding protein [Bactrocera latifrons]